MRSGWRTLLGLAAGLLLMAPLLGVLYLVPRGTHGTVVTPGGARWVPVLPDDVRRRLLTYKRACSRDEECDAPLACFWDVRVGQHYCADSECETDVQCGPEFACRTMDQQRASAISHCSPLGIRQEGEPCELMPDAKAEGCTRGLLCGGWCGRACKMNEPGSCPDGFFCEPGPEGPTCLPTCADTKCPEGQHCVDFGNRVSVCAQIHGQNCQREACAPGQRCEVRDKASLPGHAWMECVTPCSEEKQDCPPEQSCVHSKCRRPCEAHKPDSCGPGLRCRQILQGDPWVCYMKLEVP